MSSNWSGGWRENKVSLDAISETQIVAEGSRHARVVPVRSETETLRALLSFCIPEAERRSTRQRMRAGYVKLCAIAWKIARESIRERTQEEFADAIGVDRSTLTYYVNNLERLLGAEHAAGRTALVLRRRPPRVKTVKRRQKLPGPPGAAA